MCAIIWKDKQYSYRDLIEKIYKTELLIESNQIKKGTVVGIIGDFSPNSIALIFSLIRKQCILVPLTKTFNKDENKLFSIAQVEFVFRVDNKDVIISETISQRSDNDYYSVIREIGNPGLVLFTSGTSGEPKAAVHDFMGLLEKYKTKRKALRTLNFLLFDHWGGLNTMFHILSNAGIVIVTKDRNPDNICKLIEKHRIELLPTTPTFLNLMLIGGAYKNYDLNSLKIISYGTEPMPKTTLERLKIIFPNVKLLQTYGLIELGVMHTKSEKDDSLWVKVGGDGYKTRIVDGVLQIKTKSAMLGYLNAPSSFTNDGWFITGDEVLEKGDYIQILGRKSEIINVGGEKVYPSEVENAILELTYVSEVMVYGVKNSVIGNIVAADIRLNNKKNILIDKNSIKTHCLKILEKHKVPIKINFVNEFKFSERYKKIRK